MTLETIEGSVALDFRFRTFSDSVLQTYLGRPCAHFLDMHLAAPRVEAFCSSGMLFHTFAIMLEAKSGYPGTGTGIWSEEVDLVDFRYGLFWNNCCPRGFIDLSDFQTVVAVIEATASLRHLSLAFFSTFSERTLSHNLVLVIERATDLMALFISSVTQMLVLSSLCSLIGIVTGQAASILPISKPCAKVTNRWGGIEKLSLDISAALVFAAQANLCKYGSVVKFESKFTPSILISGEAEMTLEPILI